MRLSFTTTDGRTCCDTDAVEHLCDKCKAKARNATEFDPPNPYEADIAAQRKANAVDAVRQFPTATSKPRIDFHYDENGIPNPYFADLERLRK